LKIEQAYPTKTNHDVLNLVPVDFCAEVIVHIVQHTEENNGKIFHLVNPHGPVKCKKLFQAIVDFGYNLWKLLATPIGKSFFSQQSNVKKRKQTKLQKKMRCPL